MRFDIPEKKKLTFEMVIPIRWGDMDAMGHVNNTIYFRYFETIRIAWFEHIGCGPNPGGEGIVIVNACCNFIKQLEFPGDVLARHFVGHAGRTSFNTYMTLERTRSRTADLYGRWREGKGLATASASNVFRVFKQHRCRVA